MRAIQTAIALACALGSLSPAHAADPSIPAADAPAVDRAAARGRQIYAYTEASIYGAGDMVAHLPNYQNVVGGWITEGSAEAIRLTFYTKDPTPRAAYVVRFDNGRLIPGHAATAAEQTLKPDQLARIAAMRSARVAFAKEKPTACGKAPFNSVVLASPAGGYLVYYLTPQPAADAFPIGGHYLIEVSARGVAGPVRRFAGECLTASAKTPQGAKARAIGINATLDAVPTEIQVYTMYAAKLPVIVATIPSKRSWLIDATAGQTQIRLVQLKVGSPAPTH